MKVIKIIVDKLPKRCRECEYTFKVVQDIGSTINCSFLKKNADHYGDYRRHDCPLEVFTKEDKGESK